MAKRGLNFDRDTGEVNYEKTKDSLLSSSSDVLNRLIREQRQKKLSTGGRVAPDPYRCEKCFVRTFISPEMDEDFLAIARDFYLHEFKNLSTYEDARYYNVNDGEEWPSFMFYRFTLSQIMNAIHGGSTYAKSLVLCLHKTYYRKEAKTLKKFNKISFSELISLAEPTEEYPSVLGNLSRILCVADLMGIEISEDCDIVYLHFGEGKEENNNGKKYSLDISDWESQSQAVVEQQYDLRKLISMDNRANKFLANALLWLGYNRDYVDMCDEKDSDLKQRFADTVALLKKTYPGKEFSQDEIVLYSTIMHCARALCCSSSWLAKALEAVALGEESVSYDWESSKFHPVDVGEEPERVTPEKTTATTNTPYILIESNIQKEHPLPGELEMMRRVTHKLVAENKDLKDRLTSIRKLEEEINRLKNDLDASTRECVALRDYVYNLTEEDEQVSKLPIEEMKKIIAQLRIVIIGGHPNWVAKMKTEFPKWVFVNPSASGSTDTSIVEKADCVFFFTGIISHSRYYQFINIMREKKIDIKYINGVNIEKNIRDIYREVIGDSTS